MLKLFFCLSFLIGILFFNFNVFAEIKSSQQLNLEKYFSNNEIEYKKLPKSIKKFFAKNLFLPLNEYEISKENTFNRWSNHIYEMSISASLNKVWKEYSETNAEDLWKKKHSNLIILVRDNTIYQKNVIPQIGDLVILELKVIKSIKKLPVAFFITKMNAPKDGRAEICFNYSKQNVSQGEQCLSFTERIEGDQTYTKIKHDSKFGSESRFRDQFLYPYFHEAIIKEFHQVLKHNLENPD